MRIRWYGHAAFGLSPEDGPRVILDPYTPEQIGYPPIRDSADVVLISSDDDTAHCRADLITGDPAVINTLTASLEGGSATAAGLTVRAIEAAEWAQHPSGAPGQCGMVRFTLDGLEIAHMGDVGNPLTPRQIAFFEGVDILFALAGGPPTIALPDLMAMIGHARPKLIIPMHFRTLTYSPRNTHWIEAFLSRFDDDAVDFACAHDVTITKADLPDAPRVLVMDYVR